MKLNLMLRHLLSGKSLAFAIIFFVSIGFVNIANAQLLAWQFALPQPSKGTEPSINATTNNEFLEIAQLTRGGGVQPKQGNSRGFSGNFGVDESYEDAQKSNAYFQFEVSPKKGYEVSLNRLDATLRRQEQSAHVYRWAYSLDGKNFVKIGDADVDVTFTGNNGIKQQSIDLSSIKALQKVSKKITFRLYAWGALTNQGKAIAFGFGKSDSKGSNALILDGTVTKK
ncbi:hypothetical protein [Pedobacter sp.]